SISVLRRRVNLPFFYYLQAIERIRNISPYQLLVLAGLSLYEHAQLVAHYYLAGIYLCLYLRLCRYIGHSQQQCKQNRQQAICVFYPVHVSPGYKESLQCFYIIFVGTYAQQRGPAFAESLLAVFFVLLKP